MRAPESLNLPRYHRQQLFSPLGREGQRRLLGSKVLIVGLGGIGSWLSELLVRAGVGSLRLIDDDTVDWTNIARQAMYDELDAAEHSPKVISAAASLSRINHNLDVEPVVDRLAARNIAALADGVDLILDGTDNWAARFLINDYAVKMNVPWIFAGAVAAEGQVMPVLPGRGACLRCVYETPPPSVEEKKMRAAGVGVLGSAVAAVAAMEAGEAVKILAGRLDAVSPYLTKMEFWSNRVHQLHAADSAAGNDCICCKRRIFEFLQPPPA